MSQDVLPTFIPDTPGHSLRSQTAEGRDLAQKRRMNFGAHYETQLRGVLKQLESDVLVSVVDLMMKLVREIESCICQEILKEESTRQMSYANLELQMRSCDWQKKPVKKVERLGDTDSGSLPEGTSASSSAGASAAKPCALKVSHRHSSLKHSLLGEHAELKPRSCDLTLSSCESLTSSTTSSKKNPGVASCEAQVRHIMQSIEDSHLRHAVSLLLTLTLHIEGCLRKEIHKEAEARQQATRDLQKMWLDRNADASAQHSIQVEDDSESVISDSVASEAFSRQVSSQSASEPGLSPSNKELPAPASPSRARVVPGSIGKSASFHTLPSMCKAKTMPNLPMWMRVNLTKDITSEDAEDALEELKQLAMSSRMSTGKPEAPGKHSVRVGKSATVGALPGMTRGTSLSVLQGVTPATSSGVSFRQATVPETGALLTAPKELVRKLSSSMLTSLEEEASEVSDDYNVTMQRGATCDSLPEPHCNFRATSANAGSPKPPIPQLHQGKATRGSSWLK